MNRDPIKEKTMLKKIFSYQIVLCVFSTLAFAVEMDTSYSVKWSNTPWGGGSLILDPEGVVLQESGEGPYMQTALIDFERVRYVREKGTSGVTTPLKEFRKNKQKFSVYKDKD